MKASFETQITVTLDVKTELVAHLLKSSARFSSPDGDKLPARFDEAEYRDGDWAKFMSQFSDLSNYLFTNYWRRDAATDARTMSAVFNTLLSQAFDSVKFKFLLNGEPMADHNIWPYDLTCCKRYPEYGMYVTKNGSSDYAFLSRYIGDIESLKRCYRQYRGALDEVGVLGSCSFEFRSYHGPGDDEFTIAPYVFHKGTNEIEIFVDKHPRPDEIDNNDVR